MSFPYPPQPTSMWSPVPCDDSNEYKEMKKETKKSFQKYVFEMKNDKYMKLYHNKISTEKRDDTWIPEHKFLMKKGYFKLKPDVELIDISAIHPIFARSNWEFTGTDMTEEQCNRGYEEMKPALALATKFITEDELLGWWIHTEFGRAAMTVAGCEEVYLAKGPEEQDFIGARKKVRRMFQHFAEHLRFYILPVSFNALGLTTPEVSCLFEAHAIPNKEYDLDPTLTSAESDNESDSGCSVLGLLGHSAQSNNWTTQIGISSRFWYHLWDQGQLRQSTAQPWSMAYLRLQFSLARLILHELAHASGIYNNTDQESTQQPGLWVEMFHNCPGYVDRWTEMGRSWERFMFGSRLDNRTFDENGIGITVSTSWHGWAGGSIRTPVRMDWIQKWFLKETWDDIRSFKDRKHDVIDANPNSFKGIFFARRFLQTPEGDWEWRQMLYNDGEPQVETLKRCPKHKPTFDWYLGELLVDMQNSKARQKIHEFFGDAKDVNAH